MTGKDIDASRAEKIGLVNDVYPDPPEATLAAAHETAAEIAANSPLVVHGIKDVLDEQRTADVAASLRYVAAWNSAFLPSKDLNEGISQCSPSASRSSPANSRYLPAFTAGTAFVTASAVGSSVGCVVVVAPMFMAPTAGDE